MCTLVHSIPISLQLKPNPSVTSIHCLTVCLPAGPGWELGICAWCSAIGNNTKKRENRDDPFLKRAYKDQQIDTIKHQTSYRERETRRRRKQVNAFEKGQSKCITAKLKSELSQLTYA